MEFATLNTGARMPMEGFGVYQITDLDVCEKSVYEAIKAGYRLLDTAAAYGNESALGKAVKRAIADGLVKREDLFITTKVWVQDMHKAGDKAGDTYASVKRSLALSGLDYFDLVLLHQAMGDYFTAYRDLEKAAKDGLTKAIGVSNYFPSILVNLCENVEIIPAVNQIEAHPFFTREEDLRVMKSYGIVPQAWSPLAEGNYGIGKKYGKTAAQVALRWNVQRGFSIIPKSTHEERIKENLDIWDFALTEDEMKTISAKDKGKSGIINHFDPDLVKNLNHLSFEH